MLEVCWDMINDFYKIGQVIKVSGQKVLVKVFENRNSHVLLYQGNIVRNVSVGGYVKIPKGFDSIIGKIEGEYIQENNVKQEPGHIRFSKESDSIDRIIEVSIIGILSKDRFQRGLVDIPLVFSDVYILLEEEMQKIFDFSTDKNRAIVIGKINDYKGESLFVDISSLFASHIGIFGNTGSGKSNTLAKIYTECFERCSNMPGFSKSKFLVLDFNGEYISCFSLNKTIYHLTTTNDHGDKVPIGEEFLKDFEMWSVICEATEKTQKPFLKRVIKKFTKLQKADDMDKYVKSMIEGLLSSFYDAPQLFPANTANIQTMLEILGIATDITSNILSNIQLRSNGEKLYRTDMNEWCNDLDQLHKIIVNPLIESLGPVSRNTDQYTLLAFTLRYTFVDNIVKRIISEEHVAPLIARFDNRAKMVTRVFDIKEHDVSNNLTVVSLADVSTEFKKIIPLILCKYYYHQKKEMSDKSSLHIIIDEAHNILSTMSERESQTWKDYRLETFEEIIKEGRKFGVFLTIASQRPSDISETIISQLHNYFIHRLVNNEDIRAIGKTVSFIDKTSFEMIPVLPQGACIFTGVSSNFPVLVQIDLLDKDLQPKSETIDLLKLWKSK